MGLSLATFDPSLGQEWHSCDKAGKGIRQSKSRALVICSEPGIGKTALVEAAIGGARGLRLLRAKGGPVRLPSSTSPRWRNRS